MSTRRANRKRNADDDIDRGAGGHQIDASPQGEQQQDLDEYTLKRLRNNAAVNRTRQKKRIEQANTSQRVKELREENVQLERTLDQMRRELALLKEMVVVCAAKGDATGGTDEKQKQGHR